MIAVGLEIDAAIEISRQSKLVPDGAGNRLHDLAVVHRIEMTQVVAVQQVNPPFFA